jgi:hypothetical protein
MNIEIFRKIIREEVSSAIKDVLPRLLNEHFEQNKGVVKEVIEKKEDKSLRSLMEDSERNEVPPTPPAPPAVMKHYTKNPILNQILNETKATKPMESMLNADSIAMVSRGDEKKDIAAVLPNVFKKDYSKLLKAVDQKVKQTRV